LKMRIVFVIPNLGAGGAERVASLLCNEWVATGHEVTVVTFEPKGTVPIRELDGRVTLHQIDAVNRRPAILSWVATNARRFVRVRSVLNGVKPEAIVAFTTEANIVTLCSAFGLAIPVVVSERNQPVRPGLGVTIRMGRRMTYPLSAALVVQTEAIAKWARQWLRIPVQVLPNPVSLQSWQVKRRPGIGKRLIAVGRLVQQKGFDLLIEGFARLAEEHPDWTLVIYGDGPSRAALEDQIRTLPCASRIKLPGSARDLRKAYAEADLFVLPSRFEGYPNVLLEALAVGCPVIASDCPGAVAEILDYGHYGVLIKPEDVKALTAALEQMFSNEALRAKFANKAQKAVSELDTAVIGSRWIDLLSSVTAS
jgi:glycosyltransferase involved in cell wall biosynthesis